MQNVHGTRGGMPPQGRGAAGPDHTVSEAAVIGICAGRTVDGVHRASWNRGDDRGQHDGVVLEAVEKQTGDGRRLCESWGDERAERGQRAWRRHAVGK